MFLHEVNKNLNKEGFLQIDVQEASDQIITWKGLKIGQKITYVFSKLNIFLEGLIISSIELRDSDFKAYISCKLYGSNIFNTSLKNLNLKTKINSQNNLTRYPTSIIH